MNFSINNELDHKQSRSENHCKSREINHIRNSIHNREKEMEGCKIIEIGTLIFEQSDKNSIRIKSHNEKNTNFKRTGSKLTGKKFGPHFRCCSAKQLPDEL